MFQSQSLNMKKPINFIAFISGFVLFIWSCSKLPDSQIKGKWNVESFESEAYLYPFQNSTPNQYWHRKMVNDTIYDLVIDLNTNDTIQFLKFFVEEYSFLFSGESSCIKTRIAYHIVGDSIWSNWNAIIDGTWESKENHYLNFPGITSQGDWKITCRKHKTMELENDQFYGTPTGDSYHEVAHMSLKKQ